MAARPSDTVAGVGAIRRLPRRVSPSDPQTARGIVILCSTRARRVEAARLPGVGRRRDRVSWGRWASQHCYRGGIPVAFIDWDHIRPNHPLVEFGNAAWHFVPLGGDAYFVDSGFPVRPDLAGRLALFAREYGVVDRAEVAWALHQAKQRSVEAARFWPISPAEGAATLRLIASELEWLDDSLDALVSGLD